MSLSRLYYTSMNTAVPDLTSGARAARALMWTIASILTGNTVGTNGTNGAIPAGSRWTVAGSSDGVTANMSATDLWLLSAYDNTKLLSNVAGSAHSWIVLKSPNALGPLYMLIAFDSASTNICTIALAYSAWAGTSNTANPTNATSFSPMPTANATFHDNTATQYRVSLAIDANGGFVCGWGKASAGFYNGFLGVNKLIGINAGDLYPGAGLFSYQNSSPGCPNSGVFNAGCRNYNNTVGGVGEAVHCLLRLTSSGGSALSSLITAASEIDASVQGVPAWVCINSGTSRYLKGTFPDIYEVGFPVANGSTDPASGTIEHVQLGHYRVPFDLAVTL